LSDNRLQALAGRIGRFAGGDRSERLTASPEARELDDEIYQISRAFDAMADHIDLALDRQRLHEGLIANASVAIISKTLQGVVTGWNPAAEEIFGYSEAEMIGQPLTILIPPDRLDEEAEILGRIARGERIRNYQTIRRRKNGECFPISVLVSPIRDRLGTIIGASKFARDISEDVKVAEALKRAEDRYALVLKGMSVGVWDWDIRTGETFSSERLRAIIGSSPGAFSANFEKLMARLHPDDRPEVTARLQAHLEKREKFDLVYRMHRDPGESVWIHATGQAVWDATGQPVRMAGSIEDVTQRHKLEAELVEMVEKLKKTNKDLDEFAYAASHDLKAPLRVIDNTSQWLLEDLEPHLTPETRENMRLLRNRVKRMEKLLGDLLEYSRIGRAQDERFAEAVTGRDLLENILGLLSPKAGFCVVAEPAFSEMKVMRMPLQQVLLNLISNALKHHDKPHGSVKLGMQDIGSMHELTVLDDGPGIPPQFHDKVFEMFRTLKPRDQVEGSGMGLAMVRKNVEMVGGTIVLESNPGQGSLFRFTWPKLPPIPRVDA
jgi:PAS domain S-box-containing protein